MEEPRDVWQEVLLRVHYDHVLLSKPDEWDWTGITGDEVVVLESSDAEAVGHCFQEGVEEAEIVEGVCENCGGQPPVNKKSHYVAGVNHQPLDQDSFRERFFELDAMLSKIDSNIPAVELFDMTDLELARFHRLMEKARQGVLSADVRLGVE